MKPIKLKYTSFEDASILRKFTILYFIMSIIPVSFLYFLYLQFIDYGRITMNESTFTKLFAAVVAGVAVGYFAMRAMILRIIDISKKSRNVIQNIIGQDKSMHMTKETSNEIAVLTESFTEITSRLEASVKKLEDAKRTLHSVLERVGQGIASMENIDSFLSLIVETVTDALNVRVGVLMRYDPIIKDLYVKTAYGKDIPTGKTLRLDCHGGIFASLFESKQPAIFEKLPKGESLYLFSAPMVCVPLILHDDIIGIIVVCEKEQQEPFTQDEVGLLNNLALQTAVAIENSRLNEDAEKTYFETISALALAVEARDLHSRGHSDRVANLCVWVAQRMNLSQADGLLLRDAAKLHDLGKIGVPDEVLRKNGALRADEEQMMHRHPEIGEGIIKPIRSLRSLSSIVRHHHEKIDGSGYPDGLKGEQLSIYVRIMAAVDIYDALTSERPYRKAYSPDQAILEMRRMKNELDQKVIDVLEKIVL